MLLSTTNIFLALRINLYSIFDANYWSGDEKINEEGNADLTRPFTVEEVKDAVFAMEKNTAPSPNHLPIEFYQQCWDNVEIEMMNMFHDFYEQNLDICRLNYEIITLLIKLKEANRIQQYRPICLLNVSYKIFTKVLTLRL